MAELFKRPETYDEINSAWRLAIWLMLVENGVVVCGYEEIATQLGSISRHTVKKWADTLEISGVLERKSKGNQIELRLKGDYWKIAVASDVSQVEAPAVRDERPEMRAFMKVIDGATELGGQVTMTISGCNFGGGK